MRDALRPLKKDASVGKRLVWFFGLWLAGVLAVGLVGLAIKLVLS